MSLRRSAVTLLALLTLSGCTVDSAPTSTSSSSATGGSQSGGAQSGGAPSGGAQSGGARSGGSATSSDGSAAPALTCAQQTAADLTTEQKAAQLVLVAMTPSSIGTAGAQITAGHASGVFLLGGWPGIDVAAKATEQIHALSTDTAGIATWVAIDQEGGEVQQLTGPNVAEIPPATAQGGMDPQALAAEAKIWAMSLADAGADINLAPVADVVPDAVGPKNAPIGLYGRQFGATPEAVTPAMLAFLQGMQDGGVLPTVKHFPGIGRILGNTDVTGVGISDETTTAQDPALQPFQAAIDAGAPLIMVSTALYPKLDPQNKAAFSSAVVTDLLRTQMGFAGVVISDDLGAAKSVAEVPVGERLTRFVDAGGDVVLTADPAQAEVMNDAATAKYAADPQFAAKLDAAAERVLTLKDQRGQLPCSG